MPDITMCPGDGCPKRDKCWRYTAEPSPTGMQPYFVTPPYDKVADRCAYFWHDDSSYTIKLEK